MRILVIEDNPEIAKILESDLTHEGYAVDVAYSGEEGESLAETIPFDTIILDLMLPRKDGLEVCRSLRQKNIKIPILIVSGKTETEDKVKGLDSGADDYLIKPFHSAELNARIRALLRRAPQIIQNRLEVGNLKIDTTSRHVWDSGKEIALTKKELSLLDYMMLHPDIVINRSELEQHCWNLGLDSSSNIIDEHIKNLRKKLTNGSQIETIRGLGYRLKTSSENSISHPLR